MKDRRLKELEDKYFDGKSSLEEEKKLKQSDEKFFQFLKEEQDVKMDWSFEDFKKQVNADRKIVKLWRLAAIKYATAAAAVLLFFVGLSVYINRQTVSTGPILARKTSVLTKRPEVKSMVPEAKVETQQDKSSTARHDAQTAMLPRKPSKQISQQRQSAISAGYKKITKQHSAQDMEERYQAEYVLLNGEPVADEEEAVELTLKSLGLLANNLEHSVDKAMNIKQMSITIN